MALAPVPLHNKPQTDPVPPLISVCVAVYNQEDCIADTISGILSQNVPRLQLILADDASTDGTADILKKYKEENPDVIDLILHEKNLGISGNVASIYPLIKGDYVCWFAGDDLFLPGKLKKQMEYMENNPYCLLCCHDVWVKEQESGNQYLFNDPILGQRYRRKNTAERLITERCFISGISMMIRRKGTQDLEHQMEVGNRNDWLYMIEVAIRGQVHWINEPLAIYHRHVDNITRTDIDHIHEEKVYDYLEKKYADNLADDILEGRMKLYAVYWVKYLLKKEKRGQKLMSQKISNILKKKPSLIFALTSFLFKILFKRIALKIKTGSVQR